MEFPTAYLQYARSPRAEGIRDAINKMISETQMQASEAMQLYLSENPNTAFVSEVFSLIEYGVEPYTARGADFVQWYKPQSTKDTVLGYAQQDKLHGDIAEWAVKIYENPSQYPPLATGPFYQAPPASQPVQDVNLTSVAFQTEAAKMETKPASQPVVNDAVTVATNGNGPDLARLTDVEKVALWLQHSNEPIPAGTRGAANVAVDCTDASCEVDYLYKVAKAMALVPGTVDKAEMFLKANPEYAKTRQLPSVRSYLQLKTPLERIAILGVVLFVAVSVGKQIFK